MKIQILKFSKQIAGKQQPLQVELEVGPDFALLAGGELPEVYVMQVQDLVHFRGLKAQVVDRGTKHKAKGLARILLGQKKIPLVDGNFNSAGQLRRSIRTLLANAGRAGERGLYLIGVEERIFRVLRERARGPAEGEESKEKQAEPKWALPGEVDAGIMEGQSRYLLKLMRTCEEPPELKEKYAGDSDSIKLVRRLILHAAEVDDIVLILGDTGTGKEAAARAIHSYSGRCYERFTWVNCGAIPRDLLESELFGHEKGSFTGAASRKVGLWEIADKGTLFLDEIGDLPPEHQPKILRALQDKQIRRVGGETDIKSSARIIAATNRNLYRMVQNGHFREDLYYRLREFMIPTPALRHHPNDIPLLAQLFWRRMVRDEEKSLPAEILDELKTYRWPGNVRELKTVLTNLRALFPNEDLRGEHLRAVFVIQGHAAMPQEGDMTYPYQELGLQRVEALHHLQRVDEVVRACEVTLRPVLGQGKAGLDNLASADVSVELRLRELEMLCLNPLLFPEEADFLLVYRFKGKLTYLLGLLQKDIAEALGYWEQEVVGELGLVSERLAAEMKKILDSASGDGQAGSRNTITGKKARGRP